MACSKRRIHVLTGAPESASLDWNETELLNDFVPSLKKFVDQNLQRGASPRCSDNRETPLSRNISTEPARWRSVPSKHVQSPCNSFGSKVCTTTHYEEYQGQASREAAELSFFTTSDVSFSSVNSDEDHQTSKDVVSAATAGQDILSQYYEHSLAVHDEIASSQIVQESTLKDRSPSIGDSVSAATSNSLTSSSSGSETKLSSDSSTATRTQIRCVESLNRNRMGPVCDIARIPSASNIEYFLPQMITVNIIVGIINIACPRTVITRKTSQEMEIVEMIVGDETKAGFGISFWLLPEHVTKKQTPSRTSHLRETLSALRPQDVILVRNVALSTFRGKVHGQSLRTDVTKLQLLYSSTSDDRESRLPAEVGVTLGEAGKVNRVKDWVLGFVGGGPSRLLRRSMREEEDFPPDTQE
ncbi:MAG: hypothetical protein M1837_004376 [Sclerophora amabilis]|nr:MAG: hypothetical protein M1837_004376 [Sclerophora amabilis]